MGINFYAHLWSSTSLYSSFRAVCNYIQFHRPASGGIYIWRLYERPIDINYLVGANARADIISVRTRQFRSSSKLQTTKTGTMMIRFVGHIAAW
jgi:hypothetical protein